MSIYDNPKKSTSIHIGRIETVYSSGMVDVRSKTDSSFFSSVGIMNSGVEISFSVGETCILLTDGANHIVIGKMNEPIIDASGKTTIKNISVDLYDAENTFSMCAKDSLGGQMAVSVSSSFGVLLNGGGTCYSHYDPYQEKITSVSERMEMITTPVSVVVDHDGNVCTSKITFRGSVDNDAVNRDFEYDEDISKNSGFTAQIEVSDSGISIKGYNDGDQKTSIVISPDGGVSIDSSSNISIKTTEDVNIDSGEASMTLKSNGKVRIENSYVELLSLLDDLMNQIVRSKTMTFYGAQPLIPALVTIPILREQLALIKDS